MKCTARPPAPFTPGAGEIAEALADNRRGYTPEWRVARGRGDAGTALNDILARYLEIQGEGLNAMPQRLQLEFLGTLGANVLAPQPARAPLVFKLLDTASGDATVPQGTRVAAVLPPPAPSLASDTPVAGAAPPEFHTEQAFTAMRGKLAALYSIDPQADLYADHGTGASMGGLSVFDGMRPVPHRLYLGHGELFKLTGSAEIVLNFDFANAPGARASVQRPLLLEWEFLSGNGWQPLTLVQDGTERFTRDGKVTLAKFFGPDSATDTIGGHESCWIRGTVSSRTPQARIALEPGGYLVRFAPDAAAPAIAVGDLLHVQGQSATSEVLFVGEGRLIVASPLAGAAAGLDLLHAAVKVGTVTSAPDLWRLSVESARELLPGDVVTLDGSTRVRVLQTDDSSLYLSGPLARSQPGLTVELADALPPLRPEGADAEGALPQVDLIRARVGFGKSDLALDSAYVDSDSLDVSKDFFPFGEQPPRFAAFYAACEEAFSRDGARIELAFAFNQAGSGSAKVVAEFFNGTAWQALGPGEDYVDGTDSFRFPQPTDPAFPRGKVGFTVPSGWVENEVNGGKARWLRFRIASGDYGRPLSVDVVTDPNDAKRFTVTSVASTLKPPVVTRVAVRYRVLTNPQAPEFCVTENDFALAEHSDDARWPRSAFAPFGPVADRTPALHFGFTSRPPAALVSLLVHVIAPAAEGDPQPFAWDYWGARGWTPLSVRDATLGLRRTGLLQFVGAADAVPRQGVGGALYRIRARLKAGLGSPSHIVQLGGVWLNAAWGRQGQRIERDGLGTSSGTPHQSFALPIVRGLGTVRTEVPGAESTSFDAALDLPVHGVPVLGDEVVEVREWAGRGDDWQTTLAGVAPADLRFEADPQDPGIKTAAWVRWHSRPHLYRSGPQDRHYVVERARGVFQFPGDEGFIPPAGAPIVVSYVTGGGVEGNVPAGTVNELRSGVGFVESVSNPLPSAGGAATELLRAARDRGVQQVRHRGRAVTREDYEWLALGASSEVARARALPLEAPHGRGARGAVGLVLVPHSSDAQPVASPELERTVLDALARQAPAGVAAGIRIVAPSYVAVGVRAEILPLRAEEAGRVEALVRLRLARFLHPLAGHHDGRGWEFGERVYLSDIAALIEHTPGVDAVRFLQLKSGAVLHGDSVPLEPHELVAAGDSQLMIIVPSVPHALA